MDLKILKISTEINDDDDDDDDDNEGIHVAVDVIYLDFQKAFNKVSHTKQLIKMKLYGISGEIMRWVGNWLTGRRQRVLIEGVVGLGNDTEWGAAGFSAGTCAICGLYWRPKCEHLQHSVWMVSGLANVI